MCVYTYMWTLVASTCARDTHEHTHFTNMTKDTTCERENARLKQQQQKIGGDFLRLARNDEKRTLFLKRIQNKHGHKKHTHTHNKSGSSHNMCVREKKKKKITSENK